MFLSIVIPIYNDERYLRECLDSCLDQELSKDEYELICIDDGSTDLTPEILQNYAKKYQNIHIITKQHGTQFGYGRTIGLSHAKGDYVWFVDHDDIVAPGAADDLWQAALHNPGFDRICFSCYEFYDDLTEEERVNLQERKLISNDNDVYINYVTWSGILRIAFLKEHDILPHSKRIDDAAAFWGIKDYHIWNGDTIFMDECFGNGMQSIQIPGRPLYHYRRHENSETMSMAPEMVKKRKAGMLNTGLYWTYLACCQKQYYCEEKKQFGRATEETARNTFFQVSRAVNYMLKLPHKEWRQGFKHMKERHLFFRHMPEEYTLSFKTYWKRMTWKARLFPANLANYYALTEKGALWTRIFLWRKNAISNINLYKKHTIKKRAAQRRSSGLGEEK